MASTLAVRSSRAQRFLFPSQLTRRISNKSLAKSQGRLGQSSKKAVSSSLQTDYSTSSRSTPSPAKSVQASAFHIQPDDAWSPHVGLSTVATPTKISSKVKKPEITEYHSLAWYKGQLLYANQFSWPKRWALKAIATSRVLGFEKDLRKRVEYDKKMMHPVHFPESDPVFRKCKELFQRLNKDAFGNQLKVKLVLKEKMDSLGSSYMDGTISISVQEARQWINRKEDGPLAFLIAHELSHFHLGHTQKKQYCRYRFVKFLVLQDLLESAGYQVGDPKSTPYLGAVFRHLRNLAEMRICRVSKNNEYEADEGGLKAVIQAGFSEMSGVEYHRNTLSSRPSSHWSEDRRYETHPRRPESIEELEKHRQRLQPWIKETKLSHRQESKRSLQESIEPTSENQGLSSSPGSKRLRLPTRENQGLSSSPGCKRLRLL